MLAAALEGDALDGDSDCPVAGSLHYELSTNPVAVGSTMAVTFNDCVQGTPTDQVTIDGSYEFEVIAAAGNPGTSTYTLTVELVITNITVGDDAGNSQITGAMRYSRAGDATGTTELSEAIGGSALAQTEDAVTTTLTAFGISGSTTAGTTTLGAANESFTYTRSGIDTPLDVSIVEPFSGTELIAATAGSLRVQAEDESRLTLTITNPLDTTLLVRDGDGGGTAEDTIETIWDDLI